MHQVLCSTPIFVGRTAEVARVRAMATRRSGTERSVVITGERGSGKTSLVQRALDDLDCDVLWFRGDAFSGVGRWAAMLNGLGVLASAESFADALDDVTQAVAETVKGDVGVSQLGRRLVDTLCRLPRPQRASVVVFEDVHLCDPQSLELLGYLSHRNYLFGISYLVTCDADQLPAYFDGLPRVQLSGLEPEQLTQALAAWSGVVVDPAVGAALADAAAGNPTVAAELMATLAPEQLVGDTALPLPLSVTPTMTQLAAPVLATVSPAELEVLACFACWNELPADLVRRLSSAEVIAELVRRRLVETGPTGSRLSRTGLGAAALEQLDPLDRAALFGRLSEAWSLLSQPRSVLYRYWMGQADGEAVPSAADTLAGLESHVDPRLAEVLTELVAAAPPDQLRADDWIALMRVREHARHLPGAVAAFWKAWQSERFTDDDLATLVRWRWVLSQLTGDPALGLPTPVELARLTNLLPHHAFEGLVLGARSAVMLGATEHARRLLDQAQQLSRSARLQDRALWRLVYGELQNRAGQQLRPEALRELVTRWCDVTERSCWYDDVLAVRTLIAAEAYEDAQQFLLIAEAAHATTGGHAAVFLLRVRLELELATYSMSSALVTAERLRTMPTGGVVHLHGLGADLIRTEALTGLAEGTFGHLRERGCLSDELRLTRELGHQHLIAGHYADAVFLLESALRDDRTLTEAQRWDVLADLVEAQVALGNRAAAEEASRSAPSTRPSSPRSRAPASRCRALLAPPIEVRTAFAEALELTSTGLPWIYRGRALLAYGRRLSHMGATDEGAALRREAATLFRHHRLLGWYRHAEELTCAGLDGPRPRPRLQDRLDVTETQIVRLVLSGLKNKEVASELYMSLRTLEKTLTRIYRKLQVATKAEMNLVLSRDELADFSNEDSRRVPTVKVRPDSAPFPPVLEPGPPMVPTPSPGSLTSSA